MRVRNADRKERIPFGVPRKKLNIDRSTSKQLQGKVPRWINDDDDRITRAQDGGYDFVSADGTERIGDVGEQAQEQDRKVRKLVGKHKDGSPKYAYLMAIPEDFYKEDQKKKEAVNKMVDDAIRGGQPHGTPGHNINPNQGGTYVKTIDYTP